jgi:hypothetical protein
MLAESILAEIWLSVLPEAAIPMMLPPMLIELSDIKFLQIGKGYTLARESPRIGGLGGGLAGCTISISRCGIIYCSILYLHCSLKLQHL